MKALTKNELLKNLLTLPESSQVAVVWEYGGSMWAESILVEGGEIMSYNSSEDEFCDQEWTFGDGTMYYIINNVAELGGY